MYSTPYSVILLLWLFAIAAMDLRIRKVRNWMTLLGLAIGTTVLFSELQPLQVKPLNGLLGMLVAFAAFLPLYAMRWMGAGDVKFAAVAGLWFGLSSDLLIIWVIGSLLAGMHGMVVVFWRGLQASSWGAWLQAHLPAPLSTVFAGPKISTSVIQDSGKLAVQRSIPYAGYLAIAAIWVVLRTGPSLN